MKKEEETEEETEEEIEEEEEEKEKVEGWGGKKRNQPVLD